MKRFFSLFSVFLILISLLSSCSEKNNDVRELLSDILSAIPESSEPSVLYSDIGSDDFRMMSKEDFGRLYTGKWQSPACFSRISDFAVRLPLDDSGFEIHIIRCVNRSDTEEISGLLSNRIDMIKDAEIRQYAPESYEKYYTSAEIFIRKNYVFILATPDNSSVKKRIRRLV